MEDIKKLFEGYEIYSRKTYTCRVCYKELEPYYVAKGNWEYFDCDVYMPVTLCGECSLRLIQERQEITEDNVMHFLQDIGVPPRYLPYSFESFMFKNTVAETFFKEWNPFARDESSLFITGDVGTGKTHISVSILRKALLSNQDRYLRFIDFRSFMDKLRSLMNNASEYEVYWSDIINARLLIIDDFNVYTLSDYVKDKASILVNERYIHDRKTIITTNMTKEEVSTNISAAIASRINGGYTMTTTTGKDMRSSELARMKEWKRKNIKKTENKDEHKKTYVKKHKEVDFSKRYEEDDKE